MANDRKNDDVGQSGGARRTAEIVAFGRAADADLVARWKTRFSEMILPVDVEPLQDGRFLARVGVLMHPKVILAYYDLSPLRMSRGIDLVTRTDEAVTLSCVLDGMFVGEQGGVGHRLKPGEAVSLLTDRPSTLETPTGGSFVGVRVPKAMLAARGVDPDRLSALALPQNNTGLRLLRAYLDQLRRETEEIPPELRTIVAGHLADLIAASLKPMLDDPEGEPGGLRQARKARLREILRERHADPELALDTVARAAGLSTRSVQNLFEEDGTSFSDTLREIRLAHAFALLMSGRLEASRIADVAYAVGFRDVSTFNRAFRRRFGTTPREQRGLEG